MMRLLTPIISMILTLYCTVARLDDQIRPDRRYDVPAGRTIQDETGNYKCFAVAEYRTIANIIIDYRWFYDYAIALEHKVKLLETQRANLELQVEAWQRMNETNENARLTVGKLFDSSNKARLSLEKRARLELIIWRAVAGAALVSTAVFASAYSLK